MKDILTKDISFKNKKIAKTVDIPEAKKVDEITMKMIAENPEKFIEINIVNQNNIIETTYIYADKLKFKYDNNEYTVNHDKTLHNPRGNYVIPTLYYEYGKSEPIDFENKNRGIPSKVLTLLYDTRLYKILIQPDTGNLNWVLIIVGIIQIILMGIVVWGLHDKGFLPF